MGRESNLATDRLASSVVRAWRPNDVADVTRLAAGWAGMAPYRAVVGADTYCLKVPILKDDAAAPLAQRQAAVREAARSQWAAALGDVAPPVHHVDLAAGAYATAFYPGRTPSPAATRDLHLPALLAKLRVVHGATTPVPELDTAPENWLVALDPAAVLAEAMPPPSPRARAAVLALLPPLERALVAVDSGPQVPIHNDVHAGNLLIGEAGLRILDWETLTYGSRLQELGHVCSLLDVPAHRRADLAARYVAAGPPVDVDGVGLALHTALFDLKLWAHALRYGMEPEAAGSRRRLQDAAADLAGPLRAVGCTVPRELQP